MLSFNNKLINKHFSQSDPQGRTVTRRKTFKSIYVNSLYGILPRDFHILNSKREEEKKPQEGRKMTVKYTIPETHVEGLHELFYIEDLYNINIITWVEEFKYIAGICNWSETTRLSIVKTLIGSGNTSKLPRATTSERMLNNLIEVQFKEYDATRYLKRLNSIKQANYYTIDEYLKEIRKVSTEYQYCTGISNTEVDKKVEETFLANLHSKTEIKMIELQAFKVQDILKLIRQVERQLLTQVANYTPTKEKLDYKKSRSNKPISNKWCENHKMKSHNTSECYLNKKKDSAATIEESNADNNIKLKAKIINKEITTILDTGATKCFISRKLIDKLELKPKDSTTLVVKSAFNEEMTIKTKINTEISFLQIPRKEFKVELFIVTNLSSDIILGLDFIKENCIVIDYFDYTIRIGDSIVEMEDTKSKILERETLSKLGNLYSLPTVIQNTISKIKQTNTGPLKEINNSMHKIELTKDTRILKGEYPVPLKYKTELKAHINTLIEQKIIRRSKSKHCSPGFPIRKSNGEIRLVVDYKELNQNTKPEYYPFPKLNDHFMLLHKAQVFTKIDLTMGYHQIPIHPDSIDKTAFGIMGEKFEYLKMPFGLRNAPFCFQETMVNVCHGIENIIIYIDDILIYSENQADHEKHVKKLLDRLTLNNVTINLKKSIFFSKEIKFLGYIINEKGMRADTHQINKIKNLTIPKNKRQLMQVLGIIQWFRPFVVDLSKRTKNITEKLKKNQVFTWSSADKVALEKIIEDIEKEIVLSYPDISEPFELYTDASELACGGILKQGDKYINIFSRKFTDTESRYSIPEKEFLSILYSLKHFKNIILGTKIKIFNDNKNAVNYRKMKSNRIQRMSYFLEEFDIELEHIPGSYNVAADGLSRHENLNIINCHKETNDLEETIAKIKDSSNLIEDLFELHVKLGHPGQTAFYKSIHNIINIVGLKNYIKELIEQCIDCQQAKHFNCKLGKLTGHLNVQTLLSTISTDIVGPYRIFKKVGDVESNIIYGITFTDLFSRYSKIKFVKNITSKEVAKTFELAWIKEIKIPEIVISDLGRQYTGQSFNDLCDKYKIKHKYTTANNPTSNSKSERINKSINEILRIYNVGISIKQLEKLIERRLNYVYNRAIGTSPYTLVYKMNPLNKNKIFDWSDKMSRAIRMSSKLSSLNLERINEKRLEYKYQIGDLVYQRQRINRKQDLIWMGPFEVIEVVKDNVKLNKNNCIQLVNIKNIRPSSKGGRV